MSELCDATNERQLWKRHRPTKSKNKKKGAEDTSKIGGYQLRHKVHDLCFDVSTIKETGVKAKKCDDDEVHQRFLFGYTAFKV